MLERLRAALPTAPPLLVGYGATEALPVATLTAAEALSAEVAGRGRRGHGLCVGHVAPGAKVRVVRTAAGPSEAEAEATPCGEGAATAFPAPLTPPSLAHRSFPPASSASCVSPARWWHAT